MEKLEYIITELANGSRTVYNPYHQKITTLELAKETVKKYGAKNAFFEIALASEDFTEYKIVLRGQK